MFLQLLRCLGNSVAKTGRAVILHEAVRSFGVGAEISARINEELFGQLKAPVRRIGGLDCPVPFSAALEREYMWSVERIVDTVRTTLD